MTVQPLPRGRARAILRAAVALAASVVALAAWLVAPAAGAPAAADATALLRVEARSQDLLVIGVVRDDKMIIHLSRSSDNAPVRDAAMTVLLRGAAHPATAETDGSYTFQTKDLALPGTAAVEFQVNVGQVRETLKGSLEIAAAAGQADDRSNARQLWWWVLNFAVCIGFLWLFSRRRKRASD